jgi:nucleotide-binding universal stress UspA family protein
VNKVFSNILVPIDGSKYSFKAVKYAVHVSLVYGSELTLLSVVPSKITYVDSSGFLGVIPPTYLKEYENEAAKWFKRITNIIKKDQLQVKKVKTDVITTPISVVSAILEYADKKDMDLIIVGTRGITGLKRMLLGSVASGLVTYAHCPVLVVR